MQKTISVKEAVQKGKWIIIYPSILMILLPIILSIYFSVVVDNLNIVYVGIVLGIILPFIYKFIIITRWKIWAFENVKNIHQLRQKAYEEGLTYSQDNKSLFEFRSNKQNEKLNELEQKFLQEDIFQDDISLPIEMIIYRSILKVISNIIIWGFALGYGIYIYKDYKNALILILIALYLIFLNLKNLVNRNPQILLSNKGIQLLNEQFNWSEIKNEKLFVERNYGKFKRRKKYLTFSAENSNQSILIDPLNISHDDLEIALQSYRIRFEKSNS